MRVVLSTRTCAYSNNTSMSLIHCSTCWGVGTLFSDPSLGLGWTLFKVQMRYLASVLIWAPSVTVPAGLCPKALEATPMRLLREAKRSSEAPSSSATNRPVMSFFKKVPLPAIGVCIGMTPPGNVRGRPRQSLRLGTPLLWRVSGVTPPDALRVQFAIDPAKAFCSADASVWCNPSELS
ncbi:hypothetical protein EJ02DRAFT_488711 [Clathrospora elynae]|uniref:Uncharacterized protein n=1 Tax=Clathrospora elynae TaxID=706981 RepID=A0A6A5S2C7_9PLEO|nr:hypothetical protein EJ02DRAFT_488711 [Clathrospora elynae]